MIRRNGAGGAAVFVPEPDARSLERAFDTAIPPEVYDALEAQMEGGL